MKLSNNSAYRPRLSLGFKRFLLNLNGDIDRIKREVDFNSSYGFYFNHSVMASDRDLCAVEIAILFLEDRRFFVHRGVELRALPRVIKRLVKGKRIGGISTIEQQIVRIVTGRNERTFGRKLVEAILAVLVNFHCSKKALFDFYIHNSYMGYRLEGCEISSRFIFGKAAIDLSWNEACFIASLLPLPLPRSVCDLITHFASNNEFLSPEVIVDLSREVAPRWSERVNSRFNFCLKNYDFKPNSL